MVCEPAAQTVLTGAPATVSATAGDGTYAWTSLHSSEVSGNGRSYQVTYAAIGLYTVSATCNVQVEAPVVAATLQCARTTAPTRRP